MKFPRVLSVALVALAASACGGTIPAIGLDINNPSRSHGNEAHQVSQTPSQSNNNTNNNYNENNINVYGPTSAYPSSVWEKLIRDEKAVLDVADYEAKMAALYKAKELPVDAKDVPIVSGQYAKSAPPTVKGDPVITLESGEKIHYYGRATFVLLDPEQGLTDVMHVDVREPDEDYISDVWSFDGTRKRWRHMVIGVNEKMREVPLASARSLPIVGSAPPSSFLRKFNEGSTWLVMGGAVVPGPKYSELTKTLYADPRLLQKGVGMYSISEAPKRNVLGFMATLAHFRQEGLHVCKHMEKPVGDMFAGFMWTYHAAGN